LNSPRFNKKPHKNCAQSAQPFCATWPFELTIWSTINPHPSPLEEENVGIDLP